MANRYTRIFDAAGSAQDPRVGPHAGGHNPNQKVYKLCILDGTTEMAATLDSSQMESGSLVSLPWRPYAVGSLPDLKKYIQGSQMIILRGIVCR